MYAQIIFLSCLAFARSFHNGASVAPPSCSAETAASCYHLRSVLEHCLRTLAAQTARNRASLQSVPPLLLSRLERCAMEDHSLPGCSNYSVLEYCTTLYSNAATADWGPGCSNYILLGCSGTLDSNASTEDARRAARAEAQRRRRADPAIRAAEAEAKRRRRQDPDIRAAEAEKRRRRREDPAVREAVAEAIRRRRQDPAVRAAEAEKRRRRRQDPAVRAAMAEAIRRRRADPAVRAAEAQAKREARRAKCDGSTQVFEQQFRDNPFGYTCSVCHLLWFKNDLTVLPEACHSILRPVFPEADLTSFHLCASCKQSVLQGQVPRLPTTNVYGYPARQESNVPSTRPEADSALNSISTQRRRPYLCKKHTTKSKGTSTSSLTRIRSSPPMRSRNTQTEVCAQADRVTQTARIVIGTATQT